MSYLLGLPSPVIEYWIFGVSLFAISALYFGLKYDAEENLHGFGSKYDVEENLHETDEDRNRMTE